MTANMNRILNVLLLPLVVACAAPVARAPAGGQVQTAAQAPIPSPPRAASVTSAQTPGMQNTLKNAPQSAPQNAPQSVAQSVSPGTSKSLLWRVKSKSNTVYLYGTIHVGKNSFFPLADAVESAFAQSAKLVVEADITNRQSMAETMPLLMYTGPDSLETRLPKPLLERTRAQLERYRIPFDGVKQFKPFMIGGLLSIAEFARLGYDQRFGVDGYLIQTAVFKGKPLLELESVEGQLRMLGSLTEAEQEAFLGNSLTALETGKAVDQVTGMFNAWSSGDPALLELVVKKANEGMAMTEALDEKILYGRNPRMLTQIEGFLAGDQVHFVAVGAMHLVGNRGLVQMLNAKGYAIQQL